MKIEAINFDLYMIFLFEKRISLLKKMKLPSQEYSEFRKNYLSSNGMKHWLEENRGLYASVDNLKSILGAYYKYADKTLSDTTSLIALIDRYYEIYTPLESGIMTEEYWADFYNSVLTEKRVA